MYASERFLSRIAKLRKSHRTDPPDDQMSMIKDVFADMAPPLPEVVIQDLLGAFTPPVQGDPDTPVFDRCGKLADVVDVLHSEYDEENDPLAAEDWALIGEIISDSALDLDMDFVTYVMKLAVDHGAV